MNDLKPFEHGEEGTHYACDEMSKKYGDKISCCGCNKHQCKQVEKEEIKFALCVKCSYPVLDKGQTATSDFNGDGFYVSACDNPECSRYGLLTVVTK